MTSPGPDPLFQSEVYYPVYLCACALLIAWLGRTFHRAGLIFLNDAFAGNSAVAGAVARLLDIGFYLVSLGYVGITYRANFWRGASWADVAHGVCSKLGAFLLVLGFAHMFNLLLLAILRRRGAAPAAMATGA